MSPGRTGLEWRARRDSNTRPFVCSSKHSVQKHLPASLSKPIQAHLNRYPLQFPPLWVLTVLRPVLLSAFILAADSARTRTFIRLTEKGILIETPAFDGVLTAVQGRGGGRSDGSQAY